jgi:lactoylglutathione lyase
MVPSLFLDEVRHRYNKGERCETKSRQPARRWSIGYSSLFEKQFGFHCIAEPTDSNVVLTDNAGLVLTISNFDHANEVTYPKWFHIGFMQDSDEKVDEIYDRLKTAGMEPGKPGNMHGAHTFYFTAPGGFTVEVFHQRGL